MTQAEENKLIVQYEWFSNFNYLEITMAYV